MSILKVCIIGATGHVNYVLNGIKGDTGAAIVGIAPGSKGESIDAVYESTCNVGHSPRRFGDYVEMLDVLKPDIAVVACYFGDHAKVAYEAMQRGIHVFVEKPIATTFEDLKMLRAAYEDANIHLAAMFGIRYDPWFLTAWRAVKDGRIGKVRLMNAQKSYRLGMRGEHFKNRETYGGTIPWVGSHAIDWLYWFSGEEFQSVYASHSTQYNQNHGELEVTGLCQFTFTNEVFGSVNIDYLRPQGAPRHDDDRIRVAGTEGIIEVRDQKVFLITNDEDGIVELPLLPRQQIFADFLRQVRGEGVCMVSARDSFVVTEACLKARTSADEKRLVLF
jgi:predicted dehydrogenase